MVVRNLVSAEIALGLDRFHNTEPNLPEDILVESLRIKEIHSLAANVIRQVAGMRGKKLMQHTDGYITADSTGVVAIDWQNDPRGMYARVGLIEINRKREDFRQIGRATVLAFPYSQLVVEFNVKHNVQRPRFELLDGTTAYVQWLENRTQSTSDYTVQRLVGPVKPLSVDMTARHQVLDCMEHRMRTILYAAEHPASF